MKILVTKCTCDICGKEIDACSTRYVIGFGTGNWEDDSNEFTSIDNRKDVCHSCYDTFVSLLGVNMPQVAIESKPEDVETEQKTSHKRGDYDKDWIVELWKKGLTWREIIAKTGYTYGNINYAIKLARARGEVRMPVVRTKMKKTEPGYMTVVDEHGLVLSMERV